MEKALFKETGIEEKRIFPRFKVHYLADVYMGDEILFATVIDISQNGIGIVLPKKFFIKEILNIRINCNLINKEKSELQKVNIYLRAQIIWIKKEDSLYRGGLKIVDIASEDLIKLKEHILYLEKRAAIS